MLKTEFRAAIVGFELGQGARSNQTLYRSLPPRPPQIHQAVYRCEPQDIINFSEQLDFLRTLLEVKFSRSLDCCHLEKSTSYARLTGIG